MGRWVVGRWVGRFRTDWCSEALLLKPWLSILHPGVAKPPNPNVVGGHNFRLALPESFTQALVPTTSLSGLFHISMKEAIIQHTAWHVFACLRHESYYITCGVHAGSWGSDMAFDNYANQICCVTVIGWKKTNTIQLHWQVQNASTSSFTFFPGIYTSTACMHVHSTHAYAHM